MARALILAALLALAPAAYGQSYYFPNQVGPTGAEGALGPTGPAGAAGAAGEAGTDGADGLDAQPLLATYSPSAATSVSITGFVSDDLFKYAIEFKLKVSDDDAELHLLSSPDGGVTFDTDPGSYGYSTSSIDPGAGTLDNSSTSATYIGLTEDDATEGVGNSNGESIAGRITIETLGDGTTQPLFTWQIAYVNTQGRPVLSRGVGARINAAGINALRIAPDSGTITGEIRVTGVRNANSPG